jgi:hypothetical protein
VFVALWQWATVTANYRGNWTALFCTGALQPHPPLARSEHVYEFANSRGCDGQFYHHAHDPFLRSDLKNYVDDLRLRYHRIFVPLLAYGLAFGDQTLIDRAYELVFLLSVVLNVYWSCAWRKTPDSPRRGDCCFSRFPPFPSLGIEWSSMAGWPR